jgi:hypothetical protein
MLVNTPRCNPALVPQDPGVSKAAQRGQREDIVYCSLFIRLASKKKVVIPNRIYA